MSANAQKFLKLTNDDLIAARKQGIKDREVRLSTANSKGRKIGFLGAEYAQRQNSQYLRTVTSEDMMAALYHAGKIQIWEDQFRGRVFGWCDEDGSVPDDADNLPVTEVEQIVRAYLEKEGDVPAEKPAPKSRAK